jgi:DNA-binding transcriptional LysR family regulator
MELRHLRYFVAVAEELNFTRAAERLGVAQPALSRQIAMLEREVGGALFARSKRHVTLTEAGRLLLDEARSAIAQVDRAVVVGRNAASGRMGTLNVAVSSTSTFNAQPAELLRLYRARWPAVEIELHEMWTATQVAEIAAERIDAGFLHMDTDFVEQGGTLSRSGLEFEVLGREGMVAALSIDHRLARRTSVSVAELVDESFFYLPQRFAADSGGPFRRMERIRGAPIRIAQQVLNVPAMINLAAVGLGIALVPECMTSIHLPTIRYVPVEEEAGSRTLALVFQKKPRRQAAANLVELAKSAAARYANSRTSGAASSAMPPARLKRVKPKVS